MKQSPTFTTVVVLSHVCPGQKLRVLSSSLSIFLSLLPSIQKNTVTITIVAARSTAIAAIAIHTVVPLPNFIDVMEDGNEEPERSPGSENAGYAGNEWLDIL